MVSDLDQRTGCDDLDIRARPRRLASAGRGADQALVARIGADRGRQHAGHGCDRPVEAELAEHGKAIERVGRNGADRRHQPKRNRKIIMAAFLGQIGRRQIDGDSPCR
jgi:hypothetical protein